MNKPDRGLNSAEQAAERAASRMTHEHQLQTLCLAVLAVTAAGFSLYFLRSVLLPFVLALFFVCGIDPILTRIQSFQRVPRPVAVAITFACGLGLVLLFWLLIWISIASLAENSHVYRARVGRAVHSVSMKLREWLPAEEEAAVESGDPEDPSHPPAVPTPVSPQHRDINIQAYAMAGLQNSLQALSSMLFELMGNAVMIALFMFFMLTGSSQSMMRRPQLWLEIEAQIREYIVMKTLISAGTGLAVWFVLMLFGVPLATVFGLVAFFVNFIPNVGPMLMCVLPLPLIFLDPKLSLPAMITAACLMSAIQFVSGSVVEPKMMGSSFNLHPVVIMLTLLLWGVIWGLPGMFLSTPITAALRIVLDKFDYTRPVARLLAGRLHADPS
ncbi:MAG: AI-2E family transporter [Pirellulales bacterium]